MCRYGRVVAINRQRQIVTHPVSNGGPVAMVLSSLHACSGDECSTTIEGMLTNGRPTRTQRIHDGAVAFR